MELMLDTVNIERIRHYNEHLTIQGVTSNPSIIKKEGHIDFIKHMKEIRRIIGDDKSLHIQVIGDTYEAMMQDAESILHQVDDKVYIKVPTTDAGLRVMKELKARGTNVTATAIYSVLQGLLAINVGADYIAPYYNRMADIGLDSNDVIGHLAQRIEQTNSPAKILAASFKNSYQMVDALAFGAQSVTVGPDILEANLDTVAVQKAVNDFKADWESLYQKDHI